MKTLIPLFISTLLLFQTTVRADDISHTPQDTETPRGFGLGALIGGLLAGPPGAVIGAAGGGWFGSKQADSKQHIARLEKELNAKSLELAYSQNELTETKRQFETEFQKVMLNQQIQSLESLSDGIAYDIFFKTDDASIHSDVLPRIQQLAELVKPYPEITIQISGFADERGSDHYNLRLSQQRIEQVHKQFRQAGISSKRIQSHAYGERYAQSLKNNKEDYMFDRRVSIRLTLDQEA